MCWPAWTVAPEVWIDICLSYLLEYGLTQFRVNCEKKDGCQRQNHFFPTEIDFYRPSSFVAQFESLFRLQGFRGQHIVCSLSAASCFTRVAHRLRQCGVIISTRLITHGEDSEDGPHGLSNLINGSRTICSFQFSHESIDLADPLAQERLLIEEVLDETLHLVEGTFALGAHLSFSDDGFDFAGAHEVESGVSPGRSKCWAGEGKGFGRGSAECNGGDGNSSEKHDEYC
mmetsp:Transcript_19462/g.30581  ORF Transcript_19462/g.30581 Transcript_19462/m.30581 type:complete len:229 (-) Transcript_19462:307-993(-)